MASKNLSNLLDKLKYENKDISSFNVLKEESKDLAKEDSLALIAEFVKDVKKKFENREDQIEILRDASKTLEFYINEIINSESPDSFTGPKMRHKPIRSFDTPAEESGEENFNLDEF
ncbi:MAG: hypothetical protein ACOCQD_02035 [archaeon]